ncbi:MAG: UDP-N-acetylmuramoyl-L-alanine--D-glutamate ligase [Candidatus Zambryskibacteria bacterium]
MELKDKKVLLMGLGLLGGGVATARWLVERGAVLTITDMKDEESLKPSIEKLKEYKSKIKYILGRHEEKDFLNNDIIVINPDVPANNKFVELARKAGKQIENELTLFYKFCPSRKIVAVTGTRGKTTTVNWIAHFLKSGNPNTLVIGNTPEKPFLQEIKKCNADTQVVIEAPSFQLEICSESEFAPHIAVITNLYRDHINRHKSMEEYAKAKSNIFRHQKEDDFLILDKENEWTNFFLAQKPKSKILFFSEENLIIDKNEFIKLWGEHNLQNFATSSLVALTLGISPEEIKKQISSLPQIKFRQEKVFENERLSIYNDTTSTSPEALTAAMERFLSDGEKAVFISGGTDRELDYRKWAETAQKLIKPENLILLSGSATEKMKKELDGDSFNEFNSLEECFKKALEIVKKAPTSLKLPARTLQAGRRGASKIIFSPGAKSFEKFKNEFDRGEQFNLLVNKLLK